MADEVLKALGHQILVKAGFKIGGENLADLLGATDAQLAEWISGAALPPVEIVMKALDVLEPANQPFHAGAKTPRSAK